MSEMLTNVTADMLEIAESLNFNFTNDVTNATNLLDAISQNNTIGTLVNMGYISRILPSVVAMSILFALSGSNFTKDLFLFPDCYKLRV